MKRLVNFPKGAALLPYLKEGDILTYIMKDPVEERKTTGMKRHARFDYLEKCEGMSCVEKCPSKTKMKGKDMTTGEQCNWCIEALHYYLIRIKKGEDNV